MFSTSGLRDPNRPEGQSLLTSTPREFSNKTFKNENEHKSASLFVVAVLPCHAMPCCAMLCYAVLYYTIPYHTMPCHATPCNTTLYKTISSLPSPPLTKLNPTHALKSESSHAMPCHTSRNPNPQMRREQGKEDIISSPCPSYRHFSHSFHHHHHHHHHQ